MSLSVVSFLFSLQVPEKRQGGVRRGISGLWRHWPDEGESALPWGPEVGPECPDVPLPASEATDDSYGKVGHCLLLEGSATAIESEKKSVGGEEREGCGRGGGGELERGICERERRVVSFMGWVVRQAKKRNVKVKRCVLSLDTCIVNS